MENPDETKLSTLYSNSKADTIINESDIDEIFETIYILIISNMQTILGKGFGWIIYSVLDYIINISKYSSLSGSS